MTLTEPLPVTCPWCNIDTVDCECLDTETSMDAAERDRLIAVYEAEVDDIRSKVAALNLRWHELNNLLLPLWKDRVKPARRQKCGLAGGDAEIAAMVARP